MGRVAALKIAAGVVFSAFALTAYLDPTLFVAARGQSAQAAGWALLAAMAAECAARLTASVSLLGLTAQFSAPLFLAFAATYFLRFVTWDAIARAIASGLRRREPEAEAPKRAPASAYALPARVSVALEAAARAREAMRCPREAPPL